MKKNIIYIVIGIILTLVICCIGIIVGKKLFTSKVEEIISKEKIKEEQKIVYSTIIITNSQNNSKDTLKSKDLTIDDKMLDTYKQIINSNSIKEIIQKKYKYATEIELEKVKDTEIIKVVYVCDKYSEDECIDIEKMYISEFSKQIIELYNVNVYIVDEPEISSRIVINT